MLVTITYTNNHYYFYIIYQPQRYKIRTSSTSNYCFVSLNSHLFLQRHKSYQLNTIPYSPVLLLCENEFIFPNILHNETPIRCTTLYRTFLSMALLNICTMVFRPLFQVSQHSYRFPIRDSLLL